MKRFFLPALALALLLPLSPANAGECWSEPYFKASGTATVDSAVFMRSGPCQDGTDVLATAPTGATADVLAENHGWYLLRLSGGETGWSYQSFLTAASLELTESNRAEVESAYPISPATSPAEPAPAPSEPPATSYQLPTTSLYDRVKGRILLQVENSGEAWYVNPNDGKRYYMKDGPTAYEMMRKFGLGISDANLKKLKAGDPALVSKLRGKIVLQVEAHGEAFYVHPEDGKAHYLRDGKKAYEIMRFLSLGVTNSDLAKIPSETFTPLASKASAEPEDAAVSSGVISAQPAPSDIDTVKLNRYWLASINKLRAARGLRQLALDQRWVETATEYAQYMKDAQAYAHERADGSTMHEWIDAKGLEFTERYGEPDGWETNYFTENISWGYSDDSTQGVKKVLDQTMDFYLGEASVNGPHYRTLYHPDWNTVGAGFAFEPVEGKYKVYAVFHYGSLVR